MQIHCGGEALSQDLAKTLLGRGPTFGISMDLTETTVWSTAVMWDVKTWEQGAGDAAVTIGRPIANTEIYLLDRHLQPVPIGVHGELFISGDGQARVITIGRPSPPKNSYPTPLPKSPVPEMYRTGDIMRHLPKGDIQFLRRAGPPDQVAAGTASNSAKSRACWTIIPPSSCRSSS